MLKTDEFINKSTYTQNGYPKLGWVITALIFWVITLFWHSYLLINNLSISLSISFRVFLDALFVIALLSLIITAAVSIRRNVKMLIVPLSAIAVLGYFGFMFDFLTTGFFGDILSASAAIASLLRMLLLAAFIAVIYKNVERAASVIISCVFFILFVLSRILLFGLSYGIPLDVFLNVSVFFSFFGYLLADIVFALGILFYVLAMQKKPVDYSDSQHSITNVERIGIRIFLTIITFGIYGHFWIYSMCKRIKHICNKDPKCGGEIACIVLIPFYILYWFYTRSRSLYSAAVEKGVAISDNGVLCLVLSLLGLNIISYAIIQSDLNTFACGIQRGASPNTMSAGVYVVRDPVLSKNPIELIKELSALKEQGIINDDEFEEKKKDLLSRL